MIRYYTIEVDTRNGYEVPEKNFQTEYAAKKHYAGIEIGKGVIYKSLLAYDDKEGDILLAQEG